MYIFGRINNIICMMKNLTLSFLIVGIMLSFGQFSMAQNNLKGNGEVFYSTTFDWGNPADEKGWTAPDGFYFEDPDDTGFNWTWHNNDSLHAEFVNEPPMGSSSREDGYLALELNLYNNFLDPRTDVNNAVVFPTFDCSEHSSVIVRYETQFMSYSTTAGMEMMISNDAGVHWATYNVGFSGGHKARPNGAAPGTVAVFEANISDVAAGMSEVIIKINWSLTSLYFWVIDDFQLVEAWDHDLQMKYFTVEWDDGDENTTESYTHNLPISQVGGALTNFESAVINFGEMDQWGTHLNVDISKNNQSIWNNSTEPMALDVLSIDTAIVAESFTPTEFGHYKITYNFSSEEEEQTPENDVAEAFFNITDSLYSRSDDTAEESFVWGLDAYGDEGMPNEQHFVGAIFPIYGDTEIDAISAFVTGGLADGEIEFRMALYILPDPLDEDQTPIEWLTSEAVILDSAMFNTWVTLPLDKDGESEFLLEGDICYAGVEYWNWHIENIPYKRYQNFAIGADTGIEVNDPVSIVRGDVDTNFGQGITQGRKLMVRMHLNDHSNIIDGLDLSGAASMLEQNYPNPVADRTEIVFELANSSDVILEVTDMTGRIVLQYNKGQKPAGRHTMEINTESLKAGVYFYTLKAGNFVDTKRMIVAK